MPIRETTGAKLPPLGWASHRGNGRLDRAKIEPVRNHDETFMVNKPSGGLYVSPLDFHEGRVIGTLWTLRPAGNVMTEDDPIYQVLPRPRARVLVVDGKEDLIAAIAEFPMECYTPVMAMVGGSVGDTYLDWEATARRFDAVWLTGHGQHALRRYEVGHPLSMWGWDRETILWLRPAFVIGSRTTRATHAEVETILEQREMGEMAEHLREIAADPDRVREFREMIGAFDDDNLTIFREVAHTLLGAAVTHDLLGLLGTETAHDSKGDPERNRRGASVSTTGT